MKLLLIGVLSVASLSVYAAPTGKVSLGLGYGQNPVLVTKARASGSSSITRTDVFQSKVLNLYYNDALESGTKYNSGLTVTQLSSVTSKDDDHHVRIAGNIKSSISDMTDIYGGLNIGKWLDTGNEDSDVDKLDSGIGYQFGLVFNLSKNFNIDAQYMEVNNSGVIKDVGYDVRLSSLQVSANYIF